jgi:hypothetical protein
VTDRDLDELLGRIPVPAYDVRDDVARGTTRLRRRNGTLSAAGLVLAATVGTALVLHGGTGPSTAPHYAGRPSVSATPEQPSPSPVTSSEPAVVRPSPEARAIPPANYDEAVPVLRAWRNVLAEHLGDRVRWAQNSQSGGEAIGSKYDWAGGGMLELMVGRRWDDIAGFVGFVGHEWTTFRGLQARTWTDGSDRLVSVRHRDGTVVSLYASTSFGNNGTSTDTLGVTQQALLRAAADPRLRLP